MKKKLILLLAASVMASCGHLEQRSTSPSNELQDNLSYLLSTVPPVQQVREVPKFEEVRIPRHAPWLGNRISAQYADDAKSAIRTVIQGRPAVFNLRNEDRNPFVTSPVDASTIMGHLDAIMVQADWSYVVDNGVLVVSDTQTRQFTLNSIPGTGLARVSFNTFSGGSNTGSSQSGGASNSLDVFNAPYRDLEQALMSLAAEYENDEDLNGSGRGSSSGSGAGGAIGGAQSTLYSLVPSMNSLTVNGPPSFVRRVGQLVDAFNESVSKKVHLVITVYDVQFNDSSQRSIDFNVLRQAAINASVGFQGGNLISTTPGSLSLNLDFAEGNAFDGSSLILNLLRTQGQTTVRLHEAFEAMNNQVFSIQDERSTPYVSNVSLQRSDGGSISQLTPSIETETINTGLGFHVIATVAGDNINVRLSLSQADLIRFDRYEFGRGENGVSGSLPVTDSSHRVIPMTLRDGETRLIANLTQSQFRNNNSGTGLGFLSGAKTADNTEKQTVIAVTARIL